MGRNHNFKKPITKKAIKKRESHLKGLKLVRELTQDDNFVLRESDKNLGWSLSSASWYKQEYHRHLYLGFYQSVGHMEKVNAIKRNCRFSLGVILGKYKDILTKEDFQSFNLGNQNQKDFILPSLNLMPKVHKLKEAASQNIENLLTDRAIVTGYGWCTIEASKFLQKRLRVILCRFKN